MAQVRYLGIALGDSIDPTTLRTDPRLGRFVPLSEPLPVGTALELDGRTYLVRRVEEGQSSGCWLAGDAAPQPVEDEMATVRNPAPATFSGESEAPAPAEDAPEAGGDRKRRRRPKTTLGR